MNKRKNDNSPSSKKPINGFTHQDGSIKWNKLFFSTIFALIIVFIIFLGYEHFLGSNGTNDQLAKHLYQKMGIPGVFIFVYIVDTFIVPMTVDVIYPFVTDWSPLKIMLVLGTASYFGGVSGYWIGRLLSHVKTIKNFIEKLVGTHKEFIEVHGAWAVVLGALSPLPYSTICWAAGIAKVDNRKMLLACLARYLRMIVYYYILIGGLNLFNR
ncbi:MAG: VTT domain-containing protein [Spirochaetaceae bacterium]|nr:VTT domain-containing protein [Spirochaetaceae bacterium]